MSRLYFCLADGGASHGGLCLCLCLRPSLFPSLYLCHLPQYQRLRIVMIVNSMFVLIKQYPFSLNQKLSIKIYIERKQRVECTIVGKSTVAPTPAFGPSPVSLAGSDNIVRVQIGIRSGAAGRSTALEPPPCRPSSFASATASASADIRNSAEWGGEQRVAAVEHILTSLA